ncbi:eukaryotic translation initiation factor 2-alpha kinase [Coniosporium apollinis]|uniref:non-specific serine/threonine protein kinase n=1 Tax=Coniosporium apollinis TaxID=61459 RepID=A0ABQ9NJL1_9PEZI|nr:eukaryotic translation initiation factor 2-alpha kinase [Coniosporium apollinis]
MIYEIASSIQDVLEDAVQSRKHDAALPSFAKQREIDEAAAAEAVKREKEELARKKLEEQADEQRALQQMVEDEINRRRENKRRLRPSPSQPTRMASISSPDKQDGSYFAFDRVITVKDISFNAVTGLTPFRKGPVTEILAVSPVLTRDNPIGLLAMKRTRLNVPLSKDAPLKKAILDFEDELERLKTLRQQNIMNVLDFRIERLDDNSENFSEQEDTPDQSTWQISVLTELASEGSVGAVLTVADSLPTDKTSSSGGITVKLADAAFQDHLHELKDLARTTGSKSSPSRSAFWIAPELAENPRPSRKTDIWDLGVTFLQMLLGLDTPQKYSSPATLTDTLSFSAPLEELIYKCFNLDPKKRPSAFDLIPSEFFRSEAPVLFHSAPPRLLSSDTLSGPHEKRLRRPSSNTGGPFSRYASEWVEVGRLGKGGYGEVVKARNKLDGRIYAIKKIKISSPSALTKFLSEVMHLSRLNHPYVVRYYTAWPENDPVDVSETEEESTSVEDEGGSSFSTDGPGIGFRPSTRGLDFISSSGFSAVEFGEDTEDETSSVDSDEDDSDRADADKTSASEAVQEKKAPLALRRTVSAPRATRPVASTLYIQMEYCERHTLRDLIRKGLFDNPNEVWRLFRQILEGLAHIHSHGIIHRDLKPDNIFIDVTNTPRIGDFGLATSGQYQLGDKTDSNAVPDGDMTRSIGTALYVAPELRSHVGGTYNDKVDMYSLGIIFFEMCYPLRTAMERDQVIMQLRKKQHVLPEVFQGSEKATQGNIIYSLISHRPSERPGSAELLHSGKLPLQIEDETIRQALRGLSDTSSPYYHKMMSALFSQTPDMQVKDFAWDMGSSNGPHGPNAGELLLQSCVRGQLKSVFRRHGAVEVQRPIVFPRSAHYAAGTGVYQLLDASGTLVQLPFDLTLPHARALARQAPMADRTFAFGNVYRVAHTGGPPKALGEVDYDVCQTDTLDLALKEAEVIKVLDEIIDEFPSLSTAQMCFHLNHSDLLDLVMDFCRISTPLRPAVKETLSRLNIHQWTWQKIRSELRSPTIGVPSTSLDDLAKFDWRDTPEVAFAKLRSLFDGTQYVDKTHAIFAHMRTVLGYMKTFNVHRKIYISPLSSFNEKFYTGGIMFQCLYDTKRRDVLAAGGRYDRLIEEHRPKVQGNFTGCRAVGMNLSWERIASSTARYYKNSGKSNFLKKTVEESQTRALSEQWATRRCDILVASFDADVLRTTGVKIVGDLWAHDLSAELAADARSPEELLARYRDDKHSWIIIIKQDVDVFGKADLKVKSMDRKVDTDVRSSELISYLRQEIRDRDHREGTNERARLLRQPSQPEAAQAERKSNVQVLMAQHRSKKSNKWNVVEAAQSRARELLNSYQSSPIAAIETRDEIMDMIRETRLSDPDSWRAVIQRAPLAERQYLQDVHNMLIRYASDWREKEGAINESRMAFVYNFRTGGVMLYDLGL